MSRALVRHRRAIEAQGECVHRNCRKCNPRKYFVHGSLTDFHRWSFFQSFICDSLLKRKMPLPCAFPAFRAPWIDKMES